MKRVTLTPDPYAPLWRLTWLTTPPLYLCGYLRREDAEAKARLRDGRLCNDYNTKPPTDTAEGLRMPWGTAMIALSERMGCVAGWGT